MARFVRFVVHQKIAGESRQVGLFTAAYYLRDEGELRQHDRRKLEELLEWFRTELAVPPDGAISSQATFWYSNVGPFSERMWELAHLLREYDFTAELVTATFIGRIEYQDKHQVAAVPRKGRPQ